MLAFDPRPLQEGSVRQDVCRRAELVEELLRREQSVILPPLWVRNNASIAAGTPKGKGT
jgi:hypothetical protein